MRGIIAELDKPAIGTFDANGRAEARAAPERAGDVWKIRRTIVSTTSTTRTFFASYESAELPAKQLDSTPRGNDDTSEDDTIEIRAGQSILGVWTGGTPGAVATMRIIGTISR